MKTKLFAAIFTVFSFAATAQEIIILSQDFESIESINEQQWGAADIDADGISFTLVPPQPALSQLGFTGSVYGSLNHTSGQNPTVTPDSDNVLLTSALNIPAGAPASISLRLAGVGQNPEAVSHYSVCVTTDEEFLNNLETNAFLTMLDESVKLEESLNETSSKIVTIDLTEYAGQTIRIYFRHHESTGPTYFFVDDIAVTSGALGINNYSTASFSVFPNPAKDVITITGADNLLFDEVRVTDLNGRVVKSVQYNAAAQGTINVSELAVGMYLVSVSSVRGTTTQKIVKQ